MRAWLTTGGAGALAFTTEALEAADIPFEVEEVLAEKYRNSTPETRAKETQYAIYVDETRLADAQAAIERWQAEAAEAVMRENDAPPPTPEELAADIAWEEQRRRDHVSEADADAKAARARRLGAIAFAIVAAATLLGLLAGR